MTALKCTAIKRDGEPCNAYAGHGSDYCFHHDPDLVAQRRLARRNGGRARHGREIGPVAPPAPLALDTLADVAALLQRTINDALRLENSIHRARAVGYLASLLIKALDITALEDRVAHLEQTLQLRGDGR